ncbi:hypothetical protein SAMN00808754_1620 [Thermanaeromonas toyohensis ToBE]|uniref:Uncharacterized protein n=1 Tax=Thermanaeromonas toyohensis ToBE TaxID=698762 RepID=A0A1W1VUE9_9FIRM|nr:hypothetical protein [Thermanaeromonas toyohensis]SMB96731.1 hypothetical protein SAMN00808754_1620 [Thermanaeromonas toyohensis ToBE]
MRRYRRYQKCGQSAGRGYIVAVKGIYLKDSGKYADSRQEVEKAGYPEAWALREFLLAQAEI